MSDRRHKERERVWGRRPVILRFDPGHTRPNVEPERVPASGESAAANRLAALLQSVIQTDMLSSGGSPHQEPPHRSAQWHLVEPDESQKRPVRKPIEIDSAAEVEVEPSTDPTATSTLEPPSKPRHRPFWRLQTPHLFLNVISPDRS